MMMMIEFLSLSMFLILILFFFLFLPNAYGYVEESEDSLIFLFFALLVGAIFTYLISRYFTELHYTVVIFFLGVIIAVIFQQISNSDLFKISVANWEGFNGELILYIFLPALLFGDSMALNFHRVKENLLSAILLAGPGALFGALITAVFVKYALPYDWGWDLSLLFGSITCATDPVGKFPSFLFLNSYLSHPSLPYNSCSGIIELCRCKFRHDLCGRR